MSPMSPMNPMNPMNPVNAAVTGQQGLSGDDFTFLAAIVRADSAIVLEPGKEYLLAARLGPVLRDQGLPDLAALAALLRTRPHSPARAALVEAMTTNETSFFRDAHPFTVLANTVLPDLVAHRPHERVLNIWCAACSSGQEPYSIAMVVKDALAAAPGWRARITATDLSESMVARTRVGAYSQMEVGRGVPATKLVTNFTRVGPTWQVNADLKAMVSARTLNLAAPFPPLPAMDVVFLRNVLIYFDVPTKAAILSRIKTVMRPDGYLFLGAAETTLGVDPSFERVSYGPAAAYRLRERPNR